MDELKKRYLKLKSDTNQAIDALAVTQAEKKLSEQKQASEKTDFWSDNKAAQEIMKQISALSSLVEPWQQLQKRLEDVNELIELQDTSLHDEISKELEAAQKQFDDLKKQLSFRGPYDDHDCIVSIHAGAGGTDAQDWTQILFRMYSRWIEKNNYSTDVVDESSGEEAGLKRITFSVGGSFAYGKLKGEHGVHRLVRLSPFNADNLRQTSFAKVEVMPKIDKPAELEIDDKDLKIDVFRAGGHGGQSVNTTDSAVRITHLPTNIVVTIQNERSQLQNKETAQTILRSRLAQLQIEQHQGELSKLKGPNQSAEWGNQIRSYVPHPYKQVKDLRTNYETSDAQGVLDGNLNPLIEAYLEHSF